MGLSVCLLQSWLPGEEEVSELSLTCHLTFHLSHG